MCAKVDIKIARAAAMQVYVSPIVKHDEMHRENGGAIRATTGTRDRDASFVERKQSN